MSYLKLVIVTAILAGTASADPGDTAESMLKRGDAALKAGRIHQACEAYAASEKLEAKVDTELSLASCLEQDGKPVMAAKLYRGLAERDPNAARRQTSAAKAAKLEASAPKLRFAISPISAGLVVKVDGIEVSAAADVLVDQGPHEVIATAPGFAGHASAPVDRDKVILDVIVRMEPVAEPAHAEPAPASAPAPALAPMTSAPAMTAMPAQTYTAADHRKRNAVIIGAGGVAMLIGTVVVGALSSSKFDNEHALCPNARCANEADLARANSFMSDARTLRGVAIGMGIGSGVLLIASGYLLLTPTKHDSHLALHVEPGGAGIGYTASF